MTQFHVNLDINEDAAREFREDVDKALEDVGDFLVAELKKVAPVDTGTFMRSIDFVKISNQRIIVGSSDVPGKVWALEHGHSDQAPNGVFEVTVKREKETIKDIIVSQVAS